MSAGRSSATHGHGASRIHRTLQVGGRRVDEGGGAELFDPPQEGEGSIQTLVPEIGGGIIHGRIEGAEWGLRHSLGGSP